MWINKHNPHSCLERLLVEENAVLEIKQFAQGYGAGEWWHLDLNPSIQIHSLDYCP